MDMIFHGWSMRRFQAKQQWSRMSAWDLKTRFESRLPGINCPKVLTGLSSGERGGSGIGVTISGMSSLWVGCPGPGAPLGPSAGYLVLPADPGLIPRLRGGRLWNQISTLVPAASRDRIVATWSGKYF